MISKQVVDMMNEQTDKAIEACRNDPKVAELGLCYICMTPLKGGCLCTRVGPTRAGGYLQAE